MKIIKRIDLVLENCEYIHINSKYIGTIVFSDLKREIYRCAANAISDTITAKHIAIEIFKEIGDVSIIKRLTDYRDITSIIIYYDDEENSQETIHVPYEDNAIFSGNNEYEKVYVSDIGNLYIVISKKKGIEDYFKLEEINDKENIYGYGFFN